MRRSLSNCVTCSSKAPSGDASAREACAARQPPLREHVRRSRAAVGQRLGDIDRIRVRGP